MKRIIYIAVTLLFALSVLTSCMPFTTDDKTEITKDIENSEGKYNEEDSQETAGDNEAVYEDDSEPAEEEAETPAFSTEEYDYDVISLVNLNIRKEPSAASEIIGQLTKNSRALYIETISDWYKIYYNNQFGFVSSYFEYSTLLSNKSFLQIDSIIHEGYQVLGTPYEYGSQRLLLYNGQLNPSFTGKTFDCSAFIQYIFYKGAGVKLAGDSRSQSLQGKEIPYSSMQKGDLLFMYSSSRKDNTGLERIGHVVIYIGDNKILHTFGTGGVRIQELTEFWRERIITIKRMIG